MSDSLLKYSSSWFLRPQHLRKTAENNNSSAHSNISSSIPTYVSADEEFYIRKCCPVTLNHLLPDLYLTQKQHVADSSEDYDMSLKAKFEKHLEESHKEVSCSSSTSNEDEAEEKNSDVYIENDLNMRILQNTKLESRNKKLLTPHKVNYPDSDMAESPLSYLALNNTYSTPSSDKTFSPILPYSKNVPRHSSERMKTVCLQGDARKVVFPCGKHKYILESNKDSSYLDNRKNKRLAGIQNAVKHSTPTDTILARVAPRIKVDSSLADSRLPLGVSSRPSVHSSPPPSISPHLNRSSLCIQHRRTRSNSPFRQPVSTFHTRFPMLQESRESSDNLILPSPHLIQLARLRKEELMLQEKMLLRQRQKLEIERLRPPTERWYEMKDFRFHQEAHKNNLYLKNEGALPLIHERRKQLYEALLPPDY